MRSSPLRLYLTTTLIIAVSVLVAGGQSRASLRGLVIDERGARIVGASVILTDANGETKTTVSNEEGVYAFNALATGKYTLRASAKNLATSSDAEIELKAGPTQSLDLTLNVTIEEQRVTVDADTSLSTEAPANANQTVIAGKDLDALPDDPDELSAALRALAGPSMGPEGGQIFIDGFSGGSLPSKSSIREVRINQNPFAAENDQMSGRIDVFTRPGTDKLRAAAFMSFNDESLNSRNPFAAQRTAFSLRQFGGNLSGPLVANKASYIVDFERREVDDNEVVTATILDANLNPLSIGDGVLAPRRFVNFSPRVDYALNANNTLVARYSYNRSKLQNNGVGNFSLPERAYDSLLTSSNIQLTETAVINPTTINETRFQFTRSQNELLGDSSEPTVVVSGSFIGGSSQVGHSVNTDQRWELSNFTAIQQGQHTYKIGARLRHAHIVSINKSNFGGQYVFTGALVPQLDANGEIIQNSPPIPVDSLERYRRNLILNPRTLLPVDDLRHLTALDVRSRGGGAAQFSINTGNPEASVSQFDLAFYGQDDWRVRPNLTFSYGLRYEYQSNIHSPFNFAPRMAMAWSPGTPSRGRPPKMVIRAGFGVFYLRFNESSTLQANRFSGDRNSAQQFIVKENLLFDSNGQPVPPVATPLDAFPNLPPLADVSDPTQQITWHVAEDLRSSVAYGFGAQVERQLPHKFTMFAGVFIFQIQHLFRARDINAPLPGTITSTDLNGIRPFGDVGEINAYESSGRLNQNQIFVGFNSRFNQSISFFSNYSLAHASSDAEGQGARTFPVNSYDLHGEYGRASTDIRHRFAFGGTWTLPWWGLTLNPFILASTGAPFNIITGADPNGDGQFMERPSFAPAGTVCGGPSQPINVVCTQFGNFNLKPAPGEELIPRNYGHSPGYFIVNLSASKTLFFGTIHSGNSAATASRKTSGPGASATGSGKAAAAGASTVGGTPAKAVTGIPGLGPAGLGSGEAKRYSLQISINVQNLFNRVNFQPPEGNLSSPSFGQSLGLNGFGGVSAPGSVGAGNRRIIARVRFTF